MESYQVNPPNIFRKFLEVNEKPLNCHTFQVHFERKLRNFCQPHNSKFAIAIACNTVKHVSNIGLMYEKFQKKELSISHWNSCLDIRTVFWNSKQHSAIVFNTLQGILIEISLRHQNSIQSLANLNCIAFSKWAPNKNKENLKYWNFLWIRHENVANCMYELNTSNFPWSDFHTYYFQGCTISQIWNMKSGQ